jgi:transcriptional regulator with XRE-family HTH domain
MQFGEKIKVLRESQGLLQRHLAARLEIDTPMFSKIERGERKAKRYHVDLLAKILHTDESQLLSLWLAEQVIDLIKDEPLAKQVIEIVQKELKINEY